MPTSHDELIAVNAAAHHLFAANLEAGWARTYLAARHLSAAVDRWGLGYAHASWCSLIDKLASAFPESVLLDAGLASRARNGNLIDVFRDRLIFPVHAPTGAVVGFTGRAKPGSPSGTPKYLNTKATTLYDKSRTVFGLTQLRAHHVAVLTEGPADAVAVTLSGGGRYVGVAACGSSWTSHHLDAIQAVIGTGRVVIATDADRAGRTALLTLHKLLALRPLHVDAVTMPTGTDPALLHRRGTLRPLLDSATAVSLAAADITIAAHTDQLQWAHGRVNAIKAVTEIVVGCPSEHRDTLIELIAERTGTTSLIVRSTIAAALDSHGVSP